MKIFSTDIPNDKNMYGDNISIEKDGYVIIPEPIRERNVLQDDVLFYAIQQKRIQNPVSNNSDDL